MSYTFTITRQYLREASFANPVGINSLINSGTAPTVEVNINVEAKAIDDPVYYETSLHTQVQAFRKVEKEGQPAEEVLAFNGLVKYSALVQISYAEGSHPDDLGPDARKEHDQQIQFTVMVDVPKLLFPALRQTVAQLTQDGGFPPLLINPIDFDAMYRQNLAREEETASSE